MSSARDLLAVVLLTVATLLGALWLPAVWFDDHVVEQEGFLAITQPLADDPSFQRAMTDGAVEKILDNETVPGWIADRVEPLAQEQAGKAAETAAYETLWGATMVELHGALFAPGASDLDVDLAPVIETVLGAVEGQVPVLEIPRPQDATITLVTIPDVPFLTQATVLDPWAHRAGPAALILAAAALLIAAHRRMMLTVAGIGTMIAGAATWVLAQNIGDLVPDRVDQALVLGPIVQAFEGRFAADLMPQGVILLGVGALFAAVGLVLVGLHRRT